jgi:hypothetical protein
MPAGKKVGLLLSGALDQPILDADAVFAYNGNSYIPRP